MRTMAVTRPSAVLRMLLTRRAEGEADAEVAHAAGDGVGGESEDAGDGQGEREQAEDAESDGGGACGKEDGGDDLLPGRDGADGKVGIDALDDAGERGGEARARKGGGRRGAHEDMSVGVGILRDGVEEGGSRRLGERAVFAVFDDADNGEIAAAAIAEDAAEQRWAFRKPAGEGLVDDGDGRGVLVVVPGEVAAGKQTGAGGLKVAGRDAVVRRAEEILAGRAGLCLRVDAGVLLPMRSRGTLLVSAALETPGRARLRRGCGAARAARRVAVVGEVEVERRGW